jgi:hypothetical protein
MIFVVMDCELFLKVLHFFAIQLGANIVVYFFVTYSKKSCDNFIVIFKKLYAPSEDFCCNTMCLMGL